MRHASRSSRSRSVPFLALLLAAVLPMACSSSKPAPEQAEVTETLTAKAKVTAVDKAARIVELTTEKGQKLRVRCGPEVRNFDQITTGDTVRAEYQTALAVALKKPGDTSPEAAVAVGAGRAEKGATPAAGVGAAVTATVRIESVDNENHVVVFTGPNGSMQAARVQRPEGREFIRGLKKGDLVQVTYSEAVALRVEKQ